MTSDSPSECRYFVSYSGVKLPLKLVNEILPESLENRNTFYRGYFDVTDRIVCCQKVVYGEVESEHRYHYHSNGFLASAHISEDDDLRELRFNDLGESL